MPHLKTANMCSGRFTGLGLLGRGRERSYLQLQPTKSYLNLIIVIEKLPKCVTVAVLVLTYWAVKNEISYEQGA